MSARVWSEPADPCARVLDAHSREWLRRLDGTWAALGSTATADSFAEIAALHGPLEVLS